MARQTLRRDYEASPDRTSLEAAWAQGPVVFAIEGGRIEGVLTDRSNCFNLNSLVVEEGRGVYRANAQAAAELTTLAAALEVPARDAARLAAAAADWADSDDAPSDRGAEDFDYAAAEPPYRAANTLFAEVEEVRALDGVDEAVFRALRPWLCAYPGTQAATLNVNTLRPEDAALLATVLGGALSLEEARDVIEDRPAGGWPSVEEFWAVEEIAAIAGEGPAHDRVALTSTFFQLDARVYYNGAYAESTSLLSRVGGAVSVARRRIGAAE